MFIIFYNMMPDMRANFLKPIATFFNVHVCGSLFKPNIDSFHFWFVQEYILLGNLCAELVFVSLSLDFNITTTIIK